jgi:putative peptidoglycan lipid II flippase
MMGLLNAQGRVALTAFSPLLFNIALIGVTIVLLIWRRDQTQAALLLAATVGIAGLLQLTILVMHRGDRYAAPLRVAFDAPMRAFLRQAGPGMIANSGPQLLIVAGAIVASSSPSAVSWLYFANRLIELPLGIVGVAMGTVLVPEFSRAIRGGDDAQTSRTAAHALELALGLALPATLGLIVLREPIVQLLFQHGAFGVEDVTATARALAFLAIGLPGHVLVKALSPAFFARNDTATPLHATLWALGVTLLAALALGPLFGASGIAAAIALAAWSNAALLIRGGATRFGFEFDADARRRLSLIAAAALGMGALLWLKTTFVWPLTAEAHLLAQAAVLGLLIAGGIVIYGALLVLFGVLAPGDAIRAIRRPRDLRD